MKSKKRNAEYSVRAVHAYKNSRSDNECSQKFAFKTLKHFSVNSSLTRWNSLL